MIGVSLMCASLLCLTAAGAGKNDIRGVTTAQPLSAALETLELDGAQCAPVDIGTPQTCVYDAHTTMTLYYAKAEPQTVEKIVYAFAFGNLTKTRERMQRLYGLRKDQIDGEHRLFSGERLVVDLKQNAGSIAIINDAQIKKDERTAASVR